MELHAIVVRERPHELVCRQDETALVEGHEAHNVAIVGPWLRLARWSDPLRPVGVGNRMEKAVVNKRLERLHRYIGLTPRVCLDDDSAGHECDGEYDYGGKSLSLSTSPFSLLLPGDLCSSDGSRAAKANAGKVRRGGARPIAYLCKMEAKRVGDEIGKVSRRSGIVNPDPILLPTYPPFSSLIV